MRIRPILIILLLAAVLQTAAAQDSLRVHSSVTEYLQSISGQSVGLINQRVDELIDSVGRVDPAHQSAVAGMAFDFFTASPVMGHEAVAVHIADNWFLNQRLKLENEELYPVLYTYAEFNRSSLVGKPAPALRMESIDGVLTDVRSLPASEKVLFFYDTECSTCRREAPLLADLLRHYSGKPLTFEAIYTQGDRAAWESYVAETFAGIDNPDVTVVHLWDPEAATGFHKLYGVLSTPMLFLLDGQNIIRGRNLDSEALARMLQIDNADAIKYKQLFDNVFSSFNPLLYTDVEGLIDAFAQRTYPNRNLFVELFTHLFDYLRNSDSFPKQQGALYLAEKYIAGEPDRWSEEFLNRTVHALALARLNPVGAKATNLQLRNKRGKLVDLLDEKHFYTLVIFHLIDCRQCQEELAYLRKLMPELRECDIRVKLVYVGHDQEAWRKFVKKMPCRWTCLQDFAGSSDMRSLYDLEFVPHLYLIDSTGVIIAKDIRVAELQELIHLL